MIILFSWYEIISAKRSIAQAVLDVSKAGKLAEVTGGTIREQVQ